MIVLKSVLAGVAGAVILTLLWIIVAFVVPIAVPFLASRLGASRGGGIGASAAVISSGSILIAALVGFVAGCWWMFRSS